MTRLSYLDHLVQHRDGQPISVLVQLNVNQQRAADCEAHKNNMKQRHLMHRTQDVLHYVLYVLVSQTSVRVIVLISCAAVSSHLKVQRLK